MISVYRERRSDGTRLLRRPPLKLIPEVLVCYPYVSIPSFSTSSPHNAGSSHADREASLELIKLDISRTFPNLCIFQRGGPYHDVLHSILGAYTCYRPDVGYVQGMSFIAAVLILNMHTADAFIAFANLLNKPCQMAFYRVDHSLLFLLMLWKPPPSRHGGTTAQEPERQGKGHEEGKISCSFYRGDTFFVVSVFLRCVGVAAGVEAYERGSVSRSQMLTYFAAFEVFFEENLPKLFAHFRSNNLTPDIYLIDWYVSPAPRSPHIFTLLAQHTDITPLYHRTSTSPHCTTVPALHSTVPPYQHFTSLYHRTSTSLYRTTVPALHPTVPPYQHFTLPYHRTSTSPHCTTVPALHSTVPPYQHFTSLHHRTSTSLHCTTVPAPHSTVPPYQHLTPPYHRTSTSLHHTTVPAPHSTVPPPHSTVPPYQHLTPLYLRTSTSLHRSTVPAPHSTVPAPHSTVPPYQHLTPPYQHLTPPYHRTSTSLHSTTVPALHSTVPLYNHLTPPYHHTSTLLHRTTTSLHRTTISAPHSTVPPPHSTVPPYQHLTPPYHHLTPPDMQSGGLEILKCLCLCVFLMIFTLYSKSLPLDVACRVWDVFCRDGEEFLFRTALGILRLYEDVLTHMDFIHNAQFLTRLPEDINTHMLFSSIAAVSMSCRNRKWTQVLHALQKDSERASPVLKR
ncbi:hypothetical protein NFI96_023552 [Prochilodus magdalenae]|nr:hypothetical protein NFI96_023552 [Prochilodus magdalenae]